MGTHHPAALNGGMSETAKLGLKAVVPVDWLDAVGDSVVWDSNLPAGTVLDATPLVLINLNPSVSAFVKVRVNGREGLVAPDRLKHALPQWTSRWRCH